MLPDGDGLDLCRELRGESRTRHLPLLMLTARGEPMDRIVGLELGADDYLPKPFEPRELLARVKALLRRAAPQPADDDVLRFGRLEIDLGARVARLDGKACDLTGHQFDLLVVLAQSPGRVLSRDQIMDSLKGHPLEAFDRSIDVHISRIRARHRGRPEDAAPRAHRARRRLRVRPQAGRRRDSRRHERGMKSLYLRIYVTVVVGAAAVRASLRASWSSATSTRSGSATSRRPTSGSSAWGDLIQRSLPGADAPRRRRRRRRCATGRSGCACRSRSTTPNGAAHRRVRFVHAARCDDGVIQPVSRSSSTTAARCG